MRGLLSVCCLLIVSLIAFPLFANPIPGTYDGQVRHEFGMHSVQTVIQADGDGHYRIDDGVKGVLTHLGTLRDGELYRWTDNTGTGFAVFNFIKGHDNKRFGGYWGYANGIKYQRFQWSGDDRERLVLH